MKSYYGKRLNEEDLIQQTFVLMKTSSRRLHQDKYVRLSLTSSEDVFKTSSSRRICLALRLQKAPSRCLQDVLVKTNIFVLVIRLQDVFKTFPRCLQDVFKTSSKRLKDVLARRLQEVLARLLQDVSRRLQDVFKMSSRRLQKVFKTSSRRFQGVS